MKQFITMIILFGVALSTTSDAAVVPEAPPPIDTDVRVLILFEAFLVSGQEISDRKAAIQQAWDSTQFNMPVPVGLTFANGGVAEQFSANIDGMSQKDAEIEVNRLLNTLQNGGPSLRDEHKADVVIYILETAPPLLGLPSCGFVDRQYWKTGTDDFQPILGLDRRMFNSAYIAFVATRKPSGATCAKDVAAHELGHIFGAGHTNYNQPSGGLLENSRSRWQLKSTYSPPYKYQLVETVLGGSGIPTACEAFQSPPINLNVTSCIINNVFSDPINSGLAAQNAAAINKTALSVANYVQGAPPTPPSEPTECSDGMDNDGDTLVDTADPDCTGPEDTTETGPPPEPGPSGCNPVAFPPVNVSARSLGFCHPPTDGEFYEISWNHACPPEKFFIDAVQPGGSDVLGPIFGFSTNVVIDGPPASLRVRACVDFFCGPSSFPPVTITDGC